MTTERISNDFLEKNVALVWGTGTDKKKAGAFPKMES